ncbi:MAG: Omp28-related outer membrane protein [Bacteroidia bacterium]
MKKRKLLFSICFIIIAITGFFYASAQTPVRKVLLEEFTTASCGNCPMMSKHVIEWQQAHPASSVLLTIHEGSGTDAMSNSTTAAIFNAMHPSWGWFAPAVMIDRGLYPWVDSVPYLSTYLAWGSSSSPGVDSIATRLMNEPAKVGVDISGTYNSATRTINATVTAKFISSVPSGDWRINLFLVEDSVIGYPGLGAFLGWDQHCYDATWANTNYPGKFDGTSIIGYPHRHVMRKALLGNWGAQGIIPSVPVVGTTYSAPATLVVDTACKPNHLSLVAFVSSYGSSKSQKYVLNANDVIVNSSFTTGINEIDLTKNNPGSFIESIYPVPSTGQTKIIYSLTESGNSEITLYSIFGQNTDVLYSSFTTLGKHEFIFDASKFAKGVYFVSLNTTGGSHVMKFIVE